MATHLRFTGQAGSAIFDVEKRYRYELRRSIDVLDPLERTLLFVCLNPSTADESADDPTVRRCAGFARRWGYSTLVVANIFALRSTEPKELYRVRDPVGPENDVHLRRLAGEADRVIAAWGVHGALEDRGTWVAHLLTKHQRDRTLFCFGRTRWGQPRHPLYLSYGTVPQVMLSFA